MAAENVITLLTGVTAVGVGAAFEPVDPYQSFGVTATVAGTGTVTATVSISGSNDGVNYALIGSAFSLTGTTSNTQGVIITNGYKFIQAAVTAISGTGATVSATLYDHQPHAGH